MDSLFTAVVGNGGVAMLIVRNSMLLPSSWGYRELDCGNDGSMKKSATDIERGSDGER
jgi:hypothetical protein